MLTYYKPSLWQWGKGDEYYDLTDSAVYIKQMFFPQITFDKGPVEVELYRDDNMPMVWLQRHKNRDGSIDLYFDSKLNHYQKPIKVITKKWWEFWKTKYWKRCVLSEFITEVSTHAGKRLPRKSFPEVTMDDGYVGYGIRIKGKKTDDMPFRCKLCSHGYCLLELSQGKTPSCEGYEDREK